MNVKLFCRNCWNPRQIAMGVVCAFLCAFSAHLCAEEEEDGPEGNPDPLETFNRSMFIVHEGIDTVLLKPLGQGYDAIVPPPVKTGVANFYNNLWEVNRSGNAFLQGRGRDGMVGAGRLLVNSTIGIVGLFDVASELGLEPYEADFGQTLAVWGVPAGPYIFLPVVGPGTVRDFAGALVDQRVYPLWRRARRHPQTRNAFVALHVVQTRAALLPADRLVEAAALDKYTYLRSAYLQRRAALIRNARSPR
jgi:phospholipid-binding lipoprotein MlaA